jgi:hypothetical protein
LVQNASWFFKRLTALCCCSHRSDLIPLGSRPAAIPQVTWHLFGHHSKKWVSGKLANGTLCLWRSSNWPKRIQFELAFQSCYLSDIPKTESFFRFCFFSSHLHVQTLQDEENE